MDFSDNVHNVAELAFHGATEVDPEKTCRPEVLESMASWHRRADHQVSGVDLFHIDHCTAFSISYDGESGNYWPNETKNYMNEMLIREFLYRDGICSLTDERVRLFHMKFRLMAMDGDEYLLVCPYLTDAGNISGILVVCVTKMIQRGPR
jgi:hypothetical protein